MLNKDQYNEDAYNDYYAQATQGAEIKHGQKEGGKSKLLLIFLLLALIATLGYFVWENVTSIKKSETTSPVIQEEVSNQEINNREESNPKIIESTEIAIKTVEEAPEESLEAALEKTLQLAAKGENLVESSTDTKKNEETSSGTAKIVANIASQTSDAKMSPADIARIVQLVTQQMQTEKKTEEKEITNNKKKDSLEASLENVETDTLSSDTPVMAHRDGFQKKEASGNTKTNTYNKIVLEESKTNRKVTDELSQLSMEISNVINSDTDLTPTETTTYTSSLSQEADARSKEMRYHIVKKGDTLAAIALKIYGNSTDYLKLYEANPDILRRADQIYVGQRLRVPE